LILVGVFFSKLLFLVGILKLVFFGLSFGSSNLLSHFVSLEVFLHLNAAIAHIITLSNFSVPEFLNCIQFVILHIRKIAWYLIQIQGTFSLVTVCHVLLKLTLLAIFDYLEAEVSNWR